VKFDLADDAVAVGDQLAFTAVWNSGDEPLPPLTARLLLTDSANQTIFSTDLPPAGEDYPTLQWTANEAIRFPFSVGLPPDLVGGAVVTSDDALADRLAFLQNAVGAVPGPMDCYLALRGVKTLAVRMEAHCRGARAVVDFLAEHPKVVKVHFPGLPGHPGHAIAARQMKDFGGMVSFELGSAEEAVRAAERTELFFLAESLGGVESLIEVPAAMTHLSVAGSTLEVPPALVRLSVGIEHPDDLIRDLARALD